MKKVLVLGGGVSGLATDFFLPYRDDISVIGFEQHSYLGGHARSWFENNFFWDEGPHVFFGKEEEVEPFFDFSHDTQNPATVLNYADGSWVNQPIYANLIDLPKNQVEILKESLTKSPAQNENILVKSSNFKEWLLNNYGNAFANQFPLRYNEKYWKTDLSTMSVDWIESRMFKPSIGQILAGLENRQNLHYIRNFRYPKQNGYLNYFEHFIGKSRIKTSVRVLGINLKEKIVQTTNGNYEYDTLINTLPLTTFIELCFYVPDNVRQATMSLKATSMLVVNIRFKGIVKPFFHWVYVHDLDLLSTRITNYSNLNTSLTNNMDDSEKNERYTSLQVEVYESEKNPFSYSHKHIAEKVVKELHKIGVIPKTTEIEVSTYYTKTANVIFDLKRNASLAVIYEFLEKFGLPRQANEFNANFVEMNQSNSPTNDLFLVGRFAQWNYYWTHDCAKKAREVAHQIVNC